MKQTVIEKRILRLCLVQVYRLGSMALLNTGSVPNLITTRLFRNSGINAKLTKKALLLKRWTVFLVKAS